MEGFKRRGGGGVAAKSLWFRCLLLVYFSWQLAVGVGAQPAPRLAPAPAKSLAPAPAKSLAPAPAESLSLAPALSPGELNAEDKCVGVFLSYQVSKPEIIPPYSNNLTLQPYKFESTVGLINLGYEELDVWELSIDFQYGEVLAEAPDVLILSAGTLPGLQTTNDTRIVGVKTPSLLTSIDTSHNLEKISTSFLIVGTEFGESGSQNPLPKNMTLVNKGYKCAQNTSAPENEMWVCCTENATASNTTVNFLPRQLGDIVLSYDIVSASASSYTAQVSIVMNDPIGRLDYWNLSWTWQGGEIIKSMLGGQVQGSNDQDLCVYGNAASQYPDELFSAYQSCSPNPVIIDLDQYQPTYDPAVAIPYCCRNGTLLPELIDPQKSRSDVQLTVMKLPPHIAVDDIIPPADWNIAEGYTCSQPVRVSPAEFTPTALHSSSAVASWQVICNATNTAPKKCCVSFSAYYNDSLVPCPTCSCGCTTNKFPWNGETCNLYTDALLLPYQAVLLPPSNRTSLAQQLANVQHRKLPDIYPCPDNCGVSINWHVYSDYTKGWSARMTLFNWDDQPVVNWSAAIQMPAAMPGFQDAYSFNNTFVPKADLKEYSEFNNTLFMQGRNDYFNTYLIGKDSTDNPGKLQSVLSFDKRKTPGINVVMGDGFPKKVWFNGEECQLPVHLPTGNGWRLLPTFQFGIVLAVTIFLMTGETIRFL